MTSTSPLQWPLPSAMGGGPFSHLRKHQEPLEAHAHEDHQLLLPLRGRARVIAGPDEMAFEMPAGLLLPAGIEHSFSCVSADVELLAVRLSPAALELAADLERMHLPSMTRPLLLVRVTPLLRELAIALATASVDSPASTLTYPFFCAALARRLARETSTNVEPRVIQSEIVERAVSYLKAHADEPMTMAALARIAGTSMRTLHREFHKELGVGPKQWATRVRLLHAGKLLRETDVAIKEVAHRAGYPDAASFSRAFRHHLGKTPKQWRSEPNDDTGSA